MDLVALNHVAFRLTARFLNQQPHPASTSGTLGLRSQAPTTDAERRIADVNWLVYGMPVCWVVFAFTNHAQSWWVFALAGLMSAASITYGIAGSTHGFGNPSVQYVLFAVVFLPAFKRRRAPA